jgi:hypothetical protein
MPIVPCHVSRRARVQCPKVPDTHGTDELNNNAIWPDALLAAIQHPNGSHWFSESARMDIQRRP